MYKIYLTLIPIEEDEEIISFKFEGTEKDAKIEAENQAKEYLKDFSGLLEVEWCLVSEIESGIVTR